MAWVFIRLLPPRPDFVETMTEAEATLMSQHAAYWADLKASGSVLAYALGVVADQQQFHGVGIIQPADGIDANELVRNDPTMLAHVGFRVEVWPMPRAVVRG